MIQSIPWPARVTADVTAVSVSTSAVLGLLTQAFGLVGVILSCAWGACRLYEMLARYKHCANYDPEVCPKICPAACPMYAHKRKAK